MIVPNRAFVEEDSFDEVLGDSILKFSQGGVYYDAHKNPVKGKAKGNPLSKKKEAEIKKAMKAVKDKTPEFVGKEAFNNLQTLLTIAEENAKAIRAEESAE